MASKHAKLKLALTRAIIDFFLQEDLYADELKIQGTLCVTADRSAIFVTQITETVSEGLESGTFHPHRNAKKLPHSDLYAESRTFFVSDTECPEDLTFKSSQQRKADRQPPAAHTKSHDPFSFKPKLDSLGSPTRMSGHITDSLTLNSSPDDIHNLPNLTSSGSLGLRTGFSTPGLSLLEKREARTDSIFSLNSAILNAAAKSAIERLTTLSRENEQLQNACAAEEASWNDNRDKSRDLDKNPTPCLQQQSQSEPEVIDCSSSKKRRIEIPSQFTVPSQFETALKIVSPHSNDLDIPQGHHTVPDTDEPLMLVTPKRERISDDEIEPENDSNNRNMPNLGINSNGENGNISLVCDVSPREGQHKLHSPPLTSTQNPASSGCLSPWSLSSVNLKEEPSSLPVTDWSNADWMRKPRTKFSQEQLQALETEYKNDPFLSTSADKRAELARRLNITEKNVQIWFQNQRRRRRAAAYSQMHYTLSDAQGSGEEKMPHSSSNNIDNTDVTSGSPEVIPDHEGDQSRTFTPVDSENHIDGKTSFKQSQLSYAASLEDSNSSDLIIATDFSPQSSDDIGSKDKSEPVHKNDESIHEIQTSVITKGQCNNQGKQDGKNKCKGQSEDKLKGKIQAESKHKDHSKLEDEVKNLENLPEDCTENSKAHACNSCQHSPKTNHADKKDSPDVREGDEGKSP